MYTTKKIDFGYISDFLYNLSLRGLTEKLLDNNMIKHTLSSYRRKAWDKIPDIDTRKISMFQPDVPIRKILNTIDKSEYKVGFMVQLIYFTHKRMFFPVSKFQSNHVRMVERILKVKKTHLSENYPARVSTHHRKLILQLLSYKPFDKKAKLQLTELSNTLIAQRKARAEISEQLAHYCVSNSIEIPAYSVINELVIGGYSKYEENLARALKKSLTKENIDVLNLLVRNAENFILRKDVKKISQSSKINDCINSGEILTQFSRLYKSFLPAYRELNLSLEATEDFYLIIKRSTATQLRQRRNLEVRNLHLLAYIQFQFFQRQDSAVETMKQVIKEFNNKAKKSNRDKIEAQENSFLDSSLYVANVVKNSGAVFENILEICGNSRMHDKNKVKAIEKMVSEYFLADYKDNDDILLNINNQVSEINNNTHFYNYIFENSVKLQKKINPLLTALTFCEKSEDKILKAIKYYQSGIKNINTATPIAFLNKNERELVFRDDGFAMVSKYKVLLFIQFINCIKDQTLFLFYSYKNREVPSYFMPDDIWRDKKDPTLISTNLFDQKDPNKVLSIFGNEITEKLKNINENVDSNPYIKINKNGTWNIETPPIDHSTEQYISQILNEDRSIRLHEVIKEVDNFVGFSDHFHHYLKLHANENFDVNHLYAALMSLGTNIGHNLMAKSCKNGKESITLKQLRDIETARFSNENLKKANESLVSFIQSLPLPSIYTNEHGKLYTSSDGRKHVVGVDSLMSCFSFKYYGKEKGVSANLFVDENQSFFHINVLSSSDREASHMLEGISQSKQSIYPESMFNKNNHIHITDTHGYTEAIFAGLHFLGVSFAPRIKNVNKQTLYAYEASSLIKNSQFKIGPKTVINKKLIIKHWDDILRLMASIKLNYVSDIFKKLSTSARDNELYKAVKEFGRLLKTHFILNYIDNLDLRQRIEKLLSRVELGQKFSRSMFHGRNSRLFVGISDDITRALLSTTILQNIVIVWNYLYISDYLLGIKDKELREEVIQSISAGSVISWDHINLLGTFDFYHEQIKSFEYTLDEMKSIEIPT